MDTFKENRLVVKSNDLIEASYRLTLQEARIVLLLASMINRDDDGFKLYQIKVKDFAKFIGVDKNKNIYKQLAQITEKLGKRTLTIKKEDSLLQMSWLASSEYFYNEGYVELEFSDKLKPYLLQLKDRFTKYQLGSVLELKSFYSIRLYELLKQWEKLKTRTVEVHELRYALGIPDKKYKQYGHFKNRVLNPARKEINGKTETYFDFTEIKQGLKVVMLKFEIQPNQNKPNKVVEPPKVEKVKNSPLYQQLTEYFCINAKVALELIDGYPDSQILENLEYVKHYYSAGKVKDIGPYTIKAIKENYTLQLSLFDTEKQRAQKEKRKQEIEQEREEALKNEYAIYRLEEIQRYQAELTENELKQIEAECEENIDQKKAKKNPSVKKLLLQIEKEQYLSRHTNILDYDEWKKNRIANSN
jgi:plasmid replication initiation protein